MPRANRSPSLAKFFEQSANPVYILDDQLRIIFCNDALCVWAGIEKSTLLGLECRYDATAEPATAEGIAAALCPSPAVWDEGSLGSQIGFARSDGDIIIREVSFTSLCSADSDDDSNVGIFAVAGLEELAPDDIESSTDTSIHEQLHRTLLMLNKDRLHRRSAALVGNSDAMRRLRRQIAVASKADSPVLILGHDAWQRQQVAEVIHQHKSDPQRTQVLLQCEELDENLLRWSLQSLAEDGQQPISLILANVHTLHRAAQQVLVEIIERIPDTWQLIATALPTADNPYEPAHLESSLATYLGTVTIAAVALADRMSDLPLLTQHFVEQLNKATGRQIAGPTDAALDELFLYDWPGGILQLEEVIGHAHRSAKTPQVRVTDLPPLIQHARDAAAHPPEALTPIDLERILAELESHFIGQAISLAKGNKTQAAQLLSMSRPRFYRRLTQLGLDE